MPAYQRLLSWVRKVSINTLATPWGVTLTLMVRSLRPSLNPFNPNLHTKGYSKLANILYSSVLQRRFDRDGVPITCISVHPGTVKTVGFDEVVDNLPYASVLQVIFKWVMPLVLYSWRDGAMTSAFAAAAKEVKLEREKYKAAYLTPIAKITEPSKYAMDERLARELYQTTVEFLKGLGL